MKYVLGGEEIEIEPTIRMVHDPIVAKCPSCGRDVYIPWANSMLGDPEAHELVGGYEVYTPLPRDETLYTATCKCGADLIAVMELKSLETGEQWERRHEQDRTH